MNDHDARMLSAWFDANEVRGSEASLGRALAATKGAPQRPGWLVSLRGGTIAGDNQWRRSMAVPLLAATALIVALVAGAVIGGGGITPRPIPSPALPSAPPSAPPGPSPTLPVATEEARGGLVAFTHIDLLGGCRCPGRPPSLCYEAAPVGRQRGRQQRPRSSCLPWPGTRAARSHLAGHPTAAGCSSIDELAFRP